GGRSGRRVDGGDGGRGRLRRGGYRVRNVELRRGDGCRFGGGDLHGRLDDGRDRQRPNSRDGGDGFLGRRLETELPVELVEETGRKADGGNQRQADQPSAI